MNDFIQSQAAKIVTFVLTAVLVASVDTWITVHDLDINYDRIITFMDKGDRFTSANAKDLTSRIKERIEVLATRIVKLESAIDRLEIRYRELAIEMAKLPPPHWQARILALEKEQAILKGVLKARKYAN